MFRNILISMVFAALVALFAAACSSNQANIFTKDADIDPESMKNFGIVRLSSDDPQTESALARLVRSELENKGFRYVNSDADFLLAVMFYNGIQAEYMPPTAMPWTTFRPDRTGNRARIRSTVRGRDLTDREKMSSDLRRGSHQIAGYVDTLFYQNIQVYLVKPRDQERYDVLWQGEIEVENKDGDLVAAAPAMVSELMGEFPKKSGKPETREIDL